HGVTPNSIVNLTRASSFAEFVRELRVERVTQCVVFPEYADPFPARLLQTAEDVLKPQRCPGQPLRTWADRVFTKSADGEERPISSMWEGGPPWLHGVVSVTRLLARRPFVSLLGLGRSDGQETLADDCRAASEALPQRAPDSAAA